MNSLPSPISKICQQKLEWEYLSWLIQEMRVWGWKLQESDKSFQEQCQDWSWHRDTHKPSILNENRRWPEQFLWNGSVSWTETSDLHSATGLFLTLRLRFTLLILVEKLNVPFCFTHKGSTQDRNTPVFPLNNCKQLLWIMFIEKSEFPLEENTPSWF